MKYILTVLTLSFTLSNAQVTQSAPVGDTQGLEYANFMANRNPINDFFTNQLRFSEGKYSGQNVIGSPYLNEEFTPAKIYYKGEYSESVYYRINALNDEIEIKDSKLSDQIFSLNLDRNISLETEEDYKISLETIETKKYGTRNGYVTKLYTSKGIELYVRKSVKFTEAVRASSSMVRSKPARFTVFHDYYLSINGSRPLKLIPIKRKDIKRFFHDNNIKLNETQFQMIPTRIKTTDDIINIFKTTE